MAKSLILFVSCLTISHLHPRYLGYVYASVLLQKVALPAFIIRPATRTKETRRRGIVEHHHHPYITNPLSKRTKRQWATALCSEMLENNIQKSTAEARRTSVSSPFDPQGDAAFPSGALVAAPPCAKSNPEDDMNRWIRRNWPLALQHFFRDSGLLRGIVDGLAYVTCIGLIRSNPSLLRDFIRASSYPPGLSRCLDRLMESTDGKKRTNDNYDLVNATTLTKLSYGSHSQQFIDVLEPTSSNSSSRSNKGVIAFVHGGAWGSGMPWMYRLVSKPFLQSGYAVAIIGYRTYPSADVSGQVEDLNLAIDAIAKQRSDLITGDDGDGDGRIKALIGHSSGAHIGKMAILDRWWNKDSIMIESFVGLSGVFCIPSHLEWEIDRGVDEFSPMTPACGYVEESMYTNSPKFRMERVHLSSNTNGTGQSLSSKKKEEEGEGLSSLPRMLLVHGVNDTTVSYEQTSSMSDAINNPSTTSNEQRNTSDDALCDLVLLQDVGHVETVMHFMLGGRTCDIVMEWLDDDSNSES